MSVSFTITDYTEDIRYNALERFPGLDIEDFEDDPYVEWVDGVPFMSEPALDTTVDFSNDNATAILNLLSVYDDCGEWKNTELPAIIKRIIFLINKPSELSMEVRESYNVKGKTTIQNDRIVKGSEWHEFGLDIDGIIDRLNRLMVVLKKAQKLNKGVHWG